MPPAKQDEAKKRKAGPEDFAASTSAAKKKKMTKEEKAAARDRARAAMGVSPTPKKMAPSVSLKSASKKVTKSASGRNPAAKVTISPEVDAKPRAPEMPLPPTSLQRTQSTPLELAIESQVVANLKADLEGRAPVFTEAPPEHLLKFAPQELEEGYDHDENNAADPFDDDRDDDGFTCTTGPGLPSLRFSLIAEFLFIFLWIYLFWVKEGTFYRRWGHGIMARIPFLPGNPYRTAAGKPIPYRPCFATNLDDPPMKTRPECVDIPNTPCPPLGLCYGGDLQSCAAPYLEISKNRKKCQMVPSVQKVYDRVASQVAAWTMDYLCQLKKSHPKLFQNYDHSPPPQMMVNMRDPSSPTKQPMYNLEHILDLDPFLLRKVPNGGRGHNPAHSLHNVLEATNAAANHRLKLQILTKYGEIMDEETGERAVHNEYLVAVVPHRHPSWWRRQCPIGTQCRLLRMRAALEFALRTPWLLGFWAFCMVLFVIWVIAMRYYWIQAQRQQAVLAAIEDVRGFVLQSLQIHSPKVWQGPELLEFVVHSGPPVDEALLRRRIWPRVVFDIRGHPSVGKSVTMAGGDLIDVWKWQPREKPAAVPAH